MAVHASKKGAATRANAEKERAPPSRVRCPLNTIDNVKAELARVYRSAKGGRMRIEDASKLANVLAILGRLIEGAELEARIAKLEADRNALDDRL